MKVGKILLLISALDSTVCAYGEVTYLAETGFIVENRIQVKAGKEVAWKAFTEQVDQWWPSDHTWWGEDSMLSIDAVAGGCFCEKFGDKSAEHMRISFVNPNTLLRMVGGLGPLQGMGMSGALDWAFSEHEQGSEITMTYKVNGINPDGFSELAPLVDQVQAIQLQGLEKFINGNQQ